MRTATSNASPRTAKYVPSALRSRIMRAVPQKDTTPELRLRRALFAKGLRFRLHVAALPGRPDIVLPKHGIVVQVRGCFWHQHSCRDGHIPNSRPDFWIPKLARNVRRDRRDDQRLRRLGWRVFVVWECKTRNPQKLDKVVDAIFRRL